MGINKVVETLARLRVGLMNGFYGREAFWVMEIA